MRFPGKRKRVARYETDIDAPEYAVFAASGCWDNKEVQDINYITALGIDYKDNKYIIYVQMLDFATIAEAKKPNRKAPIWVGRGTGTTLTEALIDLYTSSQRRVSWGHHGLGAYGIRITT